MIKKEPFPDQMSFTGSFRYNGEELSEIKKWAGVEHPQKALEIFINTALYNGKDPQDMLKELSNGRLDQKPLEE